MFNKFKSKNDSDKSLFLLQPTQDVVLMNHVTVTMLDNQAAPSREFTV